MAWPVGTPVPEGVQAVRSLSRRIKRWCGEEAYHLFKETGIVPGDLPTLEEARERSKLEWADRNRSYLRERAHSRYHEDIEASRAAGREYQRQRYKADPEEERIKQRARYRRDIDSSRASGRARTAKRKREMDAETAAFCEAVILLDPCSYCGSKLRIERDHIVPVSSDGEGSWHNITAACKSCNIVKKARPLLMFLIYRLEV